MGGGACVIIIEGNAVQGEAAMLSATAEASCQLVDYLGQDEDVAFDIADAGPIEEFHLRAKAVLKQLNDDLDKINRDLARKYSRGVGSVLR